MSWDFHQTMKVKAAKEYTCDLYENLSMADIIVFDGKTKTWSINPKLDQEYFKFTDQELKDIQQYIDDKFKIHKGELHNYTSGKYDGEFVAARSKIAISNIVLDHELYEDN